MKYDDASWHFGADDFPEHASPQMAATHIGMFVAWAIFRGLMSEEFIADFAAQVQTLKLKQTTPGLFVWQFMEGKFSTNDLSKPAQEFANVYYNVDRSPNYLSDYQALNRDRLESELLLPDDWVTYERVRAVIDKRFSGWRPSDIVPHDDSPQNR